MNKWINVKKCMPLNDLYVRCKVQILFESEKECIFIKKYFVHQGENLTKWVSHWMPLPNPTENEK